MANIPVKSAQFKFLVRRGLGRSYLGGAEKPAAVVSQERNTDDDKANDRDPIADGSDTRRKIERRRIPQPNSAKPPYCAEMECRKTVIGQPMKLPEAEAGFDTVGGQDRMQRSERRPGQAIPDVFDNDGGFSPQEAFIRAIVAVVLKPGTISASTTFPP